MTPALIGAALLAPLVGLALLSLPATRRLGLALGPWAALPGLVLALAGAEGVRLDLPWLLIGVAFGLDETRRVFLLLTALLWTIAGLYAAAYHAADPARGRFFAFFLATMTGNLALVIALDLVGFYLAFVTMSLAAFGLVIHPGHAEARRAALVYLVLVFVGEALILPGIWLAASVAPSLDLAAMPAAVAAHGNFAIACLVLGFGVKAGLVPLHVWLPLAHPVAPTPASAVLSGAMIKAGALAWLLLLPHGVAAMPGWGALLIGLGLIAAFYGVLVGVTQDEAKAALAYSSISQMGFLTVALGIALTSPAAAPTAVLAFAAYALHHGLAKGALFLGVGVVEHAGSARKKRLALALMLVPALALAGAPLTGGVIAKTALKAAGELLDPGWAAAFDVLLPLAAAGTTALMARVLVILARTPVRAGERALGLWLPWLALIAIVGLIFWRFPGARHLVEAAWTFYALWSALWPIALGMLGAGAALWAAARGVPLVRRRIPQGDILIPLLDAAGALRRRRPWAALPRPTPPRPWDEMMAARLVHALGVAELHARRWLVAGIAGLALGFALYLGLAPA